MRIAQPISTLAARARSIAALGTLLVAAACGGGGDDNDGPTGNGGNITGTYNISSVSVNNSTDTTSPFLIGTVETEDGDIRIELLSGSLTLQSGNRYRGTTDFRISVDGQEIPFDELDQDSEGTYTVSGNTITLTDADGEVTTATRSGSEITMSEPLDIDGDGEGDATMRIVASK